MNFQNMSRQQLIERCQEFQQERRTLRNNANGLSRLNTKINRSVARITEEIFEPLNGLFDEAGWGYMIDSSAFANNGDMPRIRRKQGWHMGDGPTVAAAVVDAVRVDNADLVKENDELQVKTEQLRAKICSKNDKFKNLAQKYENLLAEVTELPQSEDEVPDLEDGKPESIELPAVSSDEYDCLLNEVRALSLNLAHATEMAEKFLAENTALPAAGK